MTAVERYNALDGQTINREELQEIAVLGAKQGQTFIAEKIAAVLAAYEDPTFQINISEKAIDRVPEDILPGLEYADTDEEFTGLEKAVAPDDIYQMITNRMLENIREASGKGYQSKWKRTSGYLIPHNFVSKKPYRGINSMMLYMPFLEPPMKNPFFLTFNQIETLKGKLKKGSVGLPVVYFTQLYKYEQAEPKLEFGSYSLKKMVAWLKKNEKKIPLLKKFSAESIAYQNAIPILKYYKVFKGEDVEGIDFDLENFKVGYMGNDIQGNDEARNEIADLIIKNYPKPQVPIEHEGERAFYDPASDSITLPPFKNFETGNDYYRTAFHELIHSTGAEKRLNRPIKNKFGTPAYAKEELVAEFGSVFTSAHAGILWYNNKNHAEYLKNWSMAIKEAQEDNRFFMRAASKAQEAADFILNPDKEGVPAYQNSLKSELKSEGPKKDQKTEQKKRKKAAFKKGDKAYYTNKKQNVTIKKVSIPKKGTALENENRVYDIAYSNGRKAIGIPESKLEKPRKEAPKPVKKTVPKLKDTNQLLEEQKKAKIQAKTKAEFEKGLKKLGLEVISYKGEQNNPQEWNRVYKLNFKDISGITLEMELEKRKNRLGETEFGGTSKIQGMGIDRDDYIYYENAGEFYEDTLNYLKDLFDMSLAEAENYKKEYENTLFHGKHPKAQLGLFGGKEISTEDFKNMKVSELKKFTLNYYNGYLKGKKVAIKKALKEVSFYGKAARKILKPMYKEKAAVIEHLEELIQDSSYNNWGTRKAKDSPEILGYLNFKSKLFIDGKKRHVRISIAIDRDRKAKFKTYEVGAKEKSGTSSRAAVANPNDGEDKPLSENKDTKKNNTGLNAPVEVLPTVTQPPQPMTENEFEKATDEMRVLEPVITEPVKPQPEPLPEPIQKTPFSLAARMEQNRNRKREYYRIDDPEIAKFLGNVEIKEKDSIGISITAPQGAGKTRFAFQLMNAFAKNYRVGHASMEEHPESGLYESKALEYIAPENLSNIYAPEINTMQDVHRLIQENDVIVIDSFEKMREIDKTVQVDKDFRKKYDGKLFIIIFQLTGDGKMRGGSKSQFDVDIVLFTEKFDDYRENYIYPDKNRYNNVPTSELKFNIYSRALIRDETNSQPVTVQDSREPEKPTGRLIATPIV